MTTDTRKNFVVFYSFEGNCRALGGAMAEAVDADVAEIFPKREISRSIAGKYLAGGKGSLFKEKTELQPLAVSVRDYGAVIVGSPVWAWNIPPATRAFLEQTDWSGCRVALFAMHRGMCGGALSSMRKIIETGGGTVMGAADFVDLRWRDADVTRARAVEWARAMLRPAGEAAS